MYRRRRSLARSVAVSLLAGALLPGCATLGSSESPFLLGAHGAPKHRSIKDDPEEATPPAGASKFAIKPPPPTRRTYRPASAPPEAPTCVGNACLAALKALVTNPDRSWIGQPQSPADYATGTRLFAYRALSSQLSCRELELAMADVASGGATFAAPVPGVTAEQSRRVLVLNGEVDAALRAEHAKRCRG